MSPLLAVPASLWQEVQADLLSTPDLERAAVGFAGMTGGDAGLRLLLRDWIPVPPDEYLVQLGYHLEVSPVFWARAAKRARQTGEAVILLHSHPRSGPPTFSPSDDAGEATLVPKLQARASVPVGAVVISPAGYAARFWQPGSRSAVVMHVTVVGSRLGRTDSRRADARFDRQIRALTSEGHAALSALRIAVVGAGGLGSHVVQQLIHLGVGEVLVIDHDSVDRSNLSRLVGASRVDALLHRSKTGVARRLARRVGGPTRVSQLRGSVVNEDVASSLLACDLAIGCTDNQWSRTVLNAIAYQYYIPVLDLGVELQQGGAMGGRVTWLLPGSACLWCLGILDAERVRIEQLPEALREAEHARGYIEGVDEPAPAVVSINGVVASLAVTELLARVTDFAGPEPRANLLLYRTADGVVRRIAAPPPRACPTCSAEGQMGAGDLASPPWSLTGSHGH